MPDTPKIGTGPVHSVLQKGPHVKNGIQTCMQSGKHSIKYCWYKASFRCSLPSQSVCFSRATLPHYNKATVEAGQIIVKEIINTSSEEVKVGGILAVECFKAERRSVTYILYSFCYMS